MLEKYLVGNLFAFLLVFCRMGSTIMQLPGFGETYVPVRIRLVFALMLSLIVTPIVQSDLPPNPASPLGLAVLLTAEITIGVFMGMLSRLLISAMHTAGMIIAMQSGLASAQMFDMNQGTQGSLFGNLLSVMAVTLLFSLDMHHLMIQGVVDSYTMLPPGEFPPVQDLANMVHQMVSSIFVIAIAFSAPHIVSGLIMYLISGAMSRLMPTMQVFFILMPLQILASIYILLIILGSAMLMYMSHMETMLTGFLAPGR